MRFILGPHSVLFLSLFQPIRNYNPWAFLYFVAFLLIAGFVVINMVVGVIIDNFQKCRDEIEENEDFESDQEDEELYGMYCVLGCI